jgi:hypothetical protein
MGAVQEQPHSLPRPSATKSGKHSDLALIATGSIALTLGIVIGAGIMWLITPSSAPETESEAASASADTSAEPSAEAAPSASASSAPTPIPRAAKPLSAAQIRLAKLRQKVKGARVKKMDAECAKYFETKLPAGYVYQGGKFEENEFVANASGCKALASASKAPWFCCPR